MRKNSRQHQAVQVQARFDEFAQAVLYWFPAGFGFVGLILHIFPKTAFPF
jgi:hypothetical protein